MSFRDILVQADEQAASTRRCEFAARLANRFNAHLTGVFLRPTIACRYYSHGPAIDAPPIIPPSVVAAYSEVMDAAEADARLRFEAAAALSSAESDWLSIEGDVPTPMIACMRRADLTIFPRDALPVLVGNGVTPARLALASGRPVIVFPDEAAGRTARLGRRILICWNGRREAARALQDAWPFIVAADSVTVLIVSSAADGPESALQRHFEHHGVSADIVVERRHDQDVGEVILDQIGRTEADLVVMGLYGHSRVQELVLGGASRTMLAKAPVPMFVSH